MPIPISMLCTEYLSAIYCNVAAPVKVIELKKPSTVKKFKNNDSAPGKKIITPRPCKVLENFSLFLYIKKPLITIIKIPGQK